MRAKAKSIFQNFPFVLVFLLHEFVVKLLGHSIKINTRLHHIHN